MINKTLRSDLLLLLTSLIWGFAFVAQLKGMEFIGPYLYNAIRFFIGAVSLVPLIFFMKSKRAKNGGEGFKLPPKRVFIIGMILGLALFLGASLQQVGMQYTTAGKAGFITGLYVVIVPIIGYFLKHKTGLPTWLGAIVAVTGLYLISFKGETSINRGDLLVLGCSLFFAIHVLLIDYYAKIVEPVLLASIQFMWCSLISLVVAIFTETIELSAIISATVPILYGGIGSVGIAYTLQIVAQKNAPAAHSAILLSFESVFAVIGGILFLSEGLTVKGIIGCLLIFTGMILSQWDLIFARKLSKN